MVNRSRAVFNFICVVALVLVSCNDNSTNSSAAILVGRAHVLGSSEPVSDARVMAQGRSTLTNSNGDFRIDDLNPGDTTITISKTGFKLFSTTVQLTEGRSGNFSFAIEPE